MSIDPLGKWMTTLDVEEPDHTLVEVFHQQTKFYPSTNALSDRRIGTHLCDQRAILEASTNRKRFFGRQPIALPEPEPLALSLGDAVNRRRSCRKFAFNAINDQVLSDILASLRVTAKGQSALFPDISLTFRSYASGGGLYPVELYVARRDFDTKTANIFHYSPHEHTLTPVVQGVPFDDLSLAMSDSDGVIDGASCIIFLTGVFRRSLTKYGVPGYRFVLIEAGEIGHQLALAAVASGQSTLFWGGSYDDYVNRIIGVDGVDESLLLTIALGEQAYD